MASFDEFMDSTRGALFLPFACSLLSLLLSVISHFKKDFGKKPSVRALKRVTERSVLLILLSAFGMACMAHYIAAIVFLYLGFAYYIVFVEFDFVHKNDPWKKRNYLGGLLIIGFILLLIFVIEIG